MIVSAQDTGLRVSVDRPTQRTGVPVRLDAAILPESIDHYRESLQTFNARINAMESPYYPQSNNSNTYAGDAFQMLTGRDPRNSTDLYFSDLTGSDVLTQQQAQCVSVKDMPPCPR